MKEAVCTWSDVAMAGGFKYIFVQEDEAAIAMTT